MFCKSSGEPPNPDVLRKDVLYSALDRLGISHTKRGAGFHAFRHSATSFLNEQTGNLKLAQKFLGHADIGTTADIYTHTSNEAERGVAVAIERAIFGDLFPLFLKRGTGTTVSFRVEGRSSGQLQ